MVFETDLYPQFYEIVGILMLLAAYIENLHKNRLFFEEFFSFMGIEVLKRDVYTRYGTKDRDE